MVAAGWVEFIGTGATLKACSVYSVSNGGRPPQSRKTKPIQAFAEEPVRFRTLQPWAGDRLQYAGDTFAGTPTHTEQRVSLLVVVSVVSIQTIIDTLYNVEYTTKMAV